MLLLAVVVTAGCANGPAMTSDSDPSFDHLEQAIQKIDDGEKRCVDDITVRTNDESAQIAGTPETSTDPRIQMLVDERDRTILECQDHGDRLRETLTSGERAEYQARVQEERDRNSLMAIMTVSSPR